MLVNSPNVTFDRVAFVQQAGAGLSYANPMGSRVSNSYFGANGFNGLDANGHSGKGGTDNFIIENSNFDGNNIELFGTNCNISCASAGSKMAHMNGFTLKGNIFQNNKGGSHGYWCDLACSNAVIVNNVFKDNGGAGVYYEVSDSGIIASNLIQGNRNYGIKLGSANTDVYNNTISDNGTNILLYDDDRSLNVGGWADVGPDTKNVNIYNNILSGGRSGISMSFWRTNATSPNTGPNTFVKGLDYNSYLRPGGSPATMIEWRDGSSVALRTLASVQQKGFETHGTESVDGAVAPLPDAVASAIGVGKASERGALVQPGKSTPTAQPKPTAPAATAKPPATAKPATPAKPAPLPVPQPAPAPSPAPPAAGGPTSAEGFEGSSTWRPFGRSTVATNHDKKHSGSTSLAIKATATNDVSGATANPVAVTATVKGATYTGSCWVMSPSPINARVRFQEYDHNWKRLENPGDGTKVAMTTAGQWYEVSVTYTAKHGGAQLPFSVYSTNMSPSSQPLFVDDCAVTAG